MLYSWIILLRENLLSYIKIYAFVWLQYTYILYLLTEQPTIYLVPEKCKNCYVSPVTVFIREIVLLF